MTRGNVAAIMKLSTDFSPRFLHRLQTVLKSLFDLV